ncbi:MAG: prolyl oligopeptidase family serine peptidase, partial [Candidatus Fervidibacter sacchari]
MVKWTAKDLVGLKVPTEVAISSDGTKIAIVVSEPDWESGVMVSNLWLWRNGGLSQWTFGDRSITRPKFSPNGNWLAFLAKSAKDDEAKNQVWLMSLNGGEPRQLTEAKEGVVVFEWHPDSKFIWCVIPEAKPEERKQAKEVDRKRRADFSYHDDALPQRALWKFELPDGKGEKVFVGDAGIYELKVSPDGRRIVFATTFTGKRDDWRRSKLFWLFVDELSPLPLCERAGAQTSPRFSPDGAKVAFLSWREPERSFSHHRIFVADFEGNWRELNSTPDLEIEALHWKHRWLFCLLQTGCTSQIWRVDENEAAPLTDSDWVITGFDVSASGKTFAAIRTNDRNPPEVWLGELEGEQIRWAQISDLNPQVKQWELPRVQVIRWRSDGMEVEGLLWLPPEESLYPTPLPTVVWVHGGPKSRAAKALLSAAGIPTFLASRGYAVLAPNFRGSSGYSNEFATANFRDLGGGDFLDILSGVEWCIAQGIADPERIGIVGGSYGGYMLALIHI